MALLTKLAREPGAVDAMLRQAADSAAPRTQTRLARANGAEAVNAMLHQSAERGDTPLSRLKTAGTNDPSIRRSVAIHESGHAVVSMLGSFGLVGLKLEVDCGCNLSHQFFPWWLTDDIANRSDCRGRAACVVAGHVATLMFDSSALHRAGAEAFRAGALPDIDDRLFTAAVRSATGERCEEQLAAWRHRAMQEAFRLLEPREWMVMNIAKALFERGEVSAMELPGLLGDAVRLVAHIPENV